MKRLEFTDYTSVKLDSSFIICPLGFGFLEDFRLFVLAFATFHFIHTLFKLASSRKDATVGNN